MTETTGCSSEQEQISSPSVSLEPVARIRLWREEVDNARKSGDMAKAEALDRQFLAIDPNFWQAHFDLGLILRMRGARNEALDAFARAAALAPPDASDPAFEHGQMLREFGRFNEAQAEMERVLKLRPGHAPVHINLGLIARAQKRDEEALRHFERSAILNPQNQGAIYEAAQILRERGWFDAARAAYARVLEINENHANALLGLALVARAQGRPDEGRALLEQAAARDPGAIAPRMELGKWLRETGAFEPAAAAYRAVLAIKPDSATALLGLALIARAQGHREEAQPLLERASECDLASLSLRFEIAQNLRELGRLEEARAAYSQVLERDPSHAAALLGLGLVLRKLGENEAALSLFDQAVELDFNPDLARMEAVRALLDGGQLDAAEERLRRLVAAAPVNHDAIALLAALLVRRSQADEALALLRDAAHRAPNNESVALLLANEYHRQRLFAEAAPLYEALWGKAKRSGQTAVDFFRCLRAMGRLDAAGRLITEASTDFPEHGGVQLEYATHLRESRRLAEADARYENPAVVAADRVASLIGRGLVAREQGRHERAAAFFSEAAAAAPDRIHPHAEWATELRERGDLEGAERVLLDFRRRHPHNAQSLLALARLAADAFDFAKAAPLYEDYLTEMTEAVGPRIELAKVYERFDNPKRMRALVDEASELDPDDYGLLEMQAHLAQMQGDLTAALAFAERACAVRPESAGIWARRASLEASLGRPEEGLKILAEGRALLGLQPALAHASVDLEKKLGYWDRALETSRSARALFPTHFDLWAQGALFDIELGHANAVEASIESAPVKTREDQGRLLHVAGEAALARFDIAAALARCAEAEALIPLNHANLHAFALAALLSFDGDLAHRRVRTLAQAIRMERLVRRRAVSMSQSHLGQMVDEFVLQPDALAEIASALSLPEPQRLAALGKICLEFPDYTGSAIALLTEMRRQNSFAVDILPLPQKSAIPLNLFQFWDEADVPADVDNLCASWRTENSAFFYRRFDEMTAFNYLRKNHRPEIAQAFARSREAGMKADIFRLAILSLEGGVYADADDRCRRPISPLLTPGFELILFQEEMGTIGTSFMAAAPGNPLVRRALEQAVDAINSGDNCMVWLSTGPGLLSRVVAEVLAESDEAAMIARQRMKILPRHELAHFVSIRCLSAYKQIDRHPRRLQWRWGRRYVARLP